MFLLRSTVRYPREMTEPAQGLPFAAAEDVADALAYKAQAVHDADKIMSAIVAKQLVEHLERSGFVVMKKPPIGGGAALGRGFEGS